MNNEPWANIGIAGESRFVELLFDSYSQSLVAQFVRDVDEHHHIKSLYIRGVPDQHYRRLTAKSETLNYEEALLSPNGPFLLVNILEAAKDGDKYSPGYDWYALQLIELPGGRIVGEIKAGDLVSEVDGQGTWVSEIHGISAEGRSVYCTIGIPERITDDYVKMQYHLAELDLQRKTFTLITALNNVFL